MNTIIAYLIERLDEPSTWRGIVWFITAFGIVLSPEQKESVVATGMAIAGLVGVFKIGRAHV